MVKKMTPAPVDADAVVTESSGNVFIDMGFAPGEAAVMALRADLIARLRLIVQAEGWTQAQAAERFGVAQSRVSDLLRGKWQKFSLDMLITLAARAGRKVELALAT
jgi:predicted XRE-type DNA-binding protein